MSYEIDHIFQIVKNEEEATELASATGFKIFPRIDHKGQGTSAIFLIFKKNYFEYIWLRDEEEAKNNFLRWDLKQKAFLNGGSPFGIAFRGRIPVKLENKFVEYKPNYGASRYQIYMLQESIENPLLPIFFIMQNPDRLNFSDWYPLKLFQERNEFCNFEHAVTEFKSVKISATEFPELRFDRLEFLEGQNELEIKCGAQTLFSSIVKLK